MAVLSVLYRSTLSLWHCAESTVLCGFLPDVSNEMENMFHDREGVCPMDAMPKLAEV